MSLFSFFRQNKTTTGDNVGHLVLLDINNTI